MFQIAVPAEHGSLHAWQLQRYKLTFNLQIAVKFCKFTILLQNYAGSKQVSDTAMRMKRVQHCTRQNPTQKL